MDTREDEKLWGDCKHCQGIETVDPDWGTCNGCGVSLEPDPDLEYDARRADSVDNKCEVSDD